MFAALKKMFGRGEDQAATTSTTPPPPIPAPRATAQAPAQPGARITPRSGEIAPRAVAPAAPAPRATTPVAAPAPAATPSRAVKPAAPATKSSKAVEPVDTGYVSIPMAVIISRIPADLAQMIQPVAIGDTALPLAVVLPMLSRGSVKVPLSVIRAGASEQAFRGPAPAADVEIDLPLAEIVARLDPAKLTRKRPSKRWDAPPEVGNLFGPKGEAIKPAQAFFNEPQPASSEPPKPSPSNATATSGDTAFLYALSRASLEEKPIAMNAMAAIPVPAKPAPAPASFAPPAAPAPAPVQPVAPAPVAPIQSASSSRPASSVAPLPPTSSGAAAGELITVSLAQVCERWPESVRVEINKLRLAASQIAIPATEMEPVLKTGRVAFTWRQVAGWLKPQAVAVGPENAELKLEFPLPVVASLFLSRFKNKDAKKVSVGADIPDVFGNATGAPVRPPVSVEPEPAPAPEPEPVAVVADPEPVAPVVEFVPPAAPAPIPFSLGGSSPAPAAAPVPSPSPVTVQPPPPVAVASAPAAPAQPLQVSRLGALFGQPQKTNWEPSEIVQRVCHLSGVAGAVIALPEGLPVAAQLPPHISADALSGFLPQMFARINQYTRELKLGESSRLVIDVNGAAMMVFRTGRVYFGVLGQSGANLPAAQLSLVATELNHLNP